MSTGPHQLIGLIDGEDATVEAVWEVYVRIGQQGDELLALVLHPGEGDGNLIVVQLLRQDGQQARLDHGRHHMTTLTGIND